MNTVVCLKTKQPERFKRAAHLEKEWKNLCTAFLPLAPEKSIWRYSRPASPDSPHQGWKLHVSATILNAGRILRAVAPFLNDRKVQFKAPSSLFELMKLNAGIFYGYNQIGKFITIYPATDNEAVCLAENLHKLTLKFGAPSVPFDFRFRRNSNVFYRFGVFRAPCSKLPDQTPGAFLITPDNQRIPDKCNSGDELPEWAANPFKPGKSISSSKKNPLQTTYSVFRALTQRGKGGVYLAFRGENLCVIKEGRKNGETDWTGGDGFTRIKNEERVLKNLLARQIQVPQVFDSFRLESNFYLVTEYFSGLNLRKLISDQKLMPSEALGYGVQLAEILARIHSSGWVWRDCKPENIIVSEQGVIRVFDFEGACRAGSREPLIWRTPDYTPPEAVDKSYQTANFAEDLYALGKTLFLLIEGYLPKSRRKPDLLVKRRGIPSQIKQIINKLLDENPAQRPAARQIAEALKIFSAKVPSLVSN